MGEAFPGILFWIARRGHEGEDMGTTTEDEGHLRVGVGCWLKEEWGKSCVGHL